MSSSTFQPEWFTIPEFAHTQPLCMYHKESEGMPSDGCTAGTQADSRGNLHVLARAEYLWESGDIPGARAVMRITADDYYKLYINGRYAGQGPAPAYPEYYYYNELDITPYLKKGKNVLAVHLYYQGLVNRVWNSGDGRFGIACEISETRCIPETDSTPEGTDSMKTEDTPKSGSTMKKPRIIIPQWRYKVSSAYSGAVTGYDTQFLEDFDSRIWDKDWNMPEFDGRMWRPMVRAEWADYQCSLQPTEMLRVYRVRPKTLKKTREGWFADMGEEITGALLVWAESDGDGKTIVIRCGEELEEAGPIQKVRYDMRCTCRYEETWTLKKGACRLEPYDYKGFRYAELALSPGIRVTRVEAEVRHYPMDETRCMLSTDNPALDGIFRICKNGVKYGTQEAYLDCPTREKGQYLGDALITAHAHVWLTGDVRMLRKCIAQFAHTAGICPGLMAVAPGDYMQEVADFSLLWSQLLLLDYQFTGDRRFLKKYLPAAEGIIRHFRRYEREDGLLEQVADKWNLVDWPENLRDGYDFELSRPVVAPGCHNVVNALYVGAVKTLEELTDMLEDPMDIPEAPVDDPEERDSGYRRETGRGEKKTARAYRWKRLRDAYINAFYDSRTGLFCDSTVSTHSALHSNIYPLFFGLCPEGSEGRIADFLVEKGLSCGVMTGYFYLKALAAAGRYEDEYRMLVNGSEHGWVNMLREGATACWEAWGKDQKWNTSLCHPWASGPIAVLIEDIAGIRPDPKEERGFRFEPHVPGELQSFRLTFPFGGRQYEVVKEKSNHKTDQKSDLSVRLCTKQDPVR